MRIVTVIGARPQFIKSAAISRLTRDDKTIEEIVVHTGQHYDPSMSQVFFDELGLPEPRYHLEIGSGSHGAQTGRMLEAIEKVLVETKPDWVLVYGDTNSTLAGALAAAKLHIPVGHVEAGLRSFNRAMPEELNRVLTDHLSTLLFAPTEAARKNLENEGMPRSRVRASGDVMLDVSLASAKRAEEKSQILKRLNLKAREYVLATLHRAENTDNPKRLRALVEGLNEVSRKFPVVAPLHPRTRKALSELKLEIAPGLQLLEPVGYLDMVRLEKNAAVVATDSGGVQKEAYFFQVPCATLRTETEWVELVETGWNRLASPESAREVSAAILGAVGKKGKAVELYGRGEAGREILQALREWRPA